MGHGSHAMGHDPSILGLLVIRTYSSESERDFSSFNARHIITSQRNSMLPETIEAVSVVLEGYKNNLIS